MEYNAASPIQEVFHPYLLTSDHVIAGCNPHPIPREKHCNLFSLLVSKPNSSNRRMLLGVVVLYGFMCICVLVYLLFYLTYIRTLQET